LQLWQLEPRIPDKNLVLFKYLLYLQTHVNTFLNKLVAALKNTLLVECLFLPSGVFFVSYIISQGLGYCLQVELLTPRHKFTLVSQPVIQLVKYALNQSK